MCVRVRLRQWIRKKSLANRDEKNYIHNYVYIFRQDFIKHPLEKPFVRVPDQYRRPEGEMEGMTSYKKEFTGNWTLFFSMAVKKIFKLYVIANKINRSAAKRQHIYIWFEYLFLETSCGKSIKLLLSNYYQRPFLREDNVKDWSFQKPKSELKHNCNAKFKYLCRYREGSAPLSPYININNRCSVPLLGKGT